MHLDSYVVFVEYLALKSHFTQKQYDYFKYHGKINTSRDIFLSRRDKAFFMRLAKLYPQNDMSDFLVANFIRGKRWIGDFLEEDADANFKEYRKRKESFSYYFKCEVETLLSQVENVKDAFRSEQNLYPPVINQYLGGTLSLEVLVVLNEFIDFRTKYDSVYNDPLWKGISMLMLKSLPFVKYDKARIKAILSDMVTNR